MLKSLRGGAGRRSPPRSTLGQRNPGTGETTMPIPMPTYLAAGAAGAAASFLVLVAAKTIW